MEDLLKHQGGFTLGAGDPMFNTVELKKAKQLTEAPSNQDLVKIVLGRRLGFHPEREEGIPISDICFFHLS